MPKFVNKITRQPIRNITEATEMDKIFTTLKNSTRKKENKNLRNNTKKMNQLNSRRHSSVGAPATAPHPPGTASLAIPANEEMEPKVKMKAEMNDSRKKEELLLKKLLLLDQDRGIG